MVSSYYFLLYGIFFSFLSSPPVPLVAAALPLSAPPPPAALPLFALPAAPPPLWSYLHPQALNPEPLIFFPAISCRHLYSPIRDNFGWGWRGYIVSLMDVQILPSLGANRPVFSITIYSKRPILNIEVVIIMFVLLILSWQLGDWISSFGIAVYLLWPFRQVTASLWAFMVIP